MKHSYTYVDIERSIKTGFLKLNNQSVFDKTYSVFASILFLGLFVILPLFIVFEINLGKIQFDDPTIFLSFLFSMGFISTYGIFFGRRLIKFNGIANAHQNRMVIHKVLMEAFPKNKVFNGEHTITSFYKPKRSKVWDWKPRNRIVIIFDRDQVLINIATLDLRNNIIIPYFTIFHHFKILKMKWRFHSLL